MQETPTNKRSATQHTTKHDDDSIFTTPYRVHLIAFPRTMYSSRMMMNMTVLVQMLQGVHNYTREGTEEILHIYIYIWYRAREQNHRSAHQNENDSQLFFMDILPTKQRTNRIASKERE